MNCIYCYWIINKYISKLKNNHNLVQRIHFEADYEDDSSNVSSLESESESEYRDFEVLGQKLKRPKQKYLPLIEIISAREFIINN